MRTDTGKWLGGDSARGLIKRGIHRKIVICVHNDDTGTQMLSVRVMRKTKGKRLLRHRMARVLMVEEPLPRLRSERPVSNGRLKKRKGIVQAFSARVVGNTSSTTTRIR